MERPQSWRESEKERERMGKSRKKVEREEKESEDRQERDERGIRKRER